MQRKQIEFYWHFNLSKCEQFRGDLFKEKHLFSLLNFYLNLKVVPCFVLFFSLSLFFFLSVFSFLDLPMRSEESQNEYMHAKESRSGFRDLYRNVSLCKSIFQCAHNDFSFYINVKNNP